MTVPPSIARAAEAARDRAAAEVAARAAALLPGAEIDIVEGRVTIAGRGLWRRWARDARLRWLGASR